MSQRRPWIVGTAIFGILFLFTLLFPQKVAGIFLRLALRDLRHHGVYIRLNHLTASTADLSIDVPHWKIQLEHVRPVFHVENIFPLKFTIAWNEHAADYEVADFHFEGFSLAVLGNYGLLTGWEFAGAIASSTWSRAASLRGGELTGKWRFARDGTELDLRTQVNGHQTALRMSGKFEDLPGSHDLAAKLLFETDYEKFHFTAPFSLSLQTETEQLSLRSTGNCVLRVAEKIFFSGSKWALDLKSEDAENRTLVKSSLTFHRPLPAEVSAEGTFLGNSGKGDVHWQTAEARAPVAQAAAHWELAWGEKLLLGITAPATNWKSSWLQLGGPLTFRFEKEDDRSSFALRAPALQSSQGQALLPWLAPFSVDAQADGEANGAKWEVTVGLHDTAKRWHGSGRGEFDTQRQRGQLHLDLPVVFDAEVTPASFVPSLEDDWEAVLGKLAIGTDLSWSAEQKLMAKVKIDAEEFSAKWRKTPISGASFHGRAEVFPKARGLGVQKFAVEKVGATNFSQFITGSFEVPSLQEFRLVDLRMIIPGGTMRVLPFTAKMPSFDFAAEARAEHVDIGQVFRFLNLEKLGGEGFVSGDLPFGMAQGSLWIRHAMLTNDGPGILRYHDESLSGVDKSIDYLDQFNDLLSRGQQALAFKALDNFHYQDFRFIIERSVAEGLALSLHLRGRNPNLAKGQLFEINLPVTGDVESLLTQSLLNSLMENSAWEQQIQKNMRKRH